MKKVVLIVIDGLTPAMLERAVETDDVPALRFLMNEGEYRRAVTTFPSLTPVCLSSIATGAHPDVHEIPHLVWYHRGEERGGRVRLLVRGDPRGRDDARDPRRRLQPERGASLA